MFGMETVALYVIFVFYGHTYLNVISRLVILKKKMAQTKQGQFSPTVCSVQLPDRQPTVSSAGNCLPAACINYAGLHQPPSA